MDQNSSHHPDDAQTPRPVAATTPAAALDHEKRPRRRDTRPWEIPTGRPTPADRHE